jgi:hypothetical protein
METYSPKPRGLYNSGVLARESTSPVGGCTRNDGMPWQQQSFCLSPHTSHTLFIVNLNHRRADQPAGCPIELTLQNFPVTLYYSQSTLLHMDVGPPPSI